MLIKSGKQLKVVVSLEGTTSLGLHFLATLHLEDGNVAITFRLRGQELWVLHYSLIHFYEIGVGDERPDFIKSPILAADLTDYGPRVQTSATS